MIALVGALLLTGCKSQWIQNHEVHNLVTTDVVIHTEPTRARLKWENVSIGKAPVRLPVEYDHTEQLWSRQNNQGARMREDMGPILTILTFPVWAIASFFHTTEDRRVHVYGNNEFTVSASATGHHTVEHAIKLEGEDEVNVSLRLEER